MCCFMLLVCLLLNSSHTHKGMWSACIYTHPQSKTHTQKIASFLASLTNALRTSCSSVTVTTGPVGAEITQGGMM